MRRGLHRRVGGSDRRQLLESGMRLFRGFLGLQRRLARCDHRCQAGGGVLGRLHPGLRGREQRLRHPSEYFPMRRAPAELAVRVVPVYRCHRLAENKGPAHLEGQGAGRQRRRGLCSHSRPTTPRLRSPRISGAC